MRQIHLSQKRNPAEVWSLYNLVTKVLTRIYCDKLGKEVRVHLQRLQFIRQRLYVDGYHRYSEIITVVSKQRLSQAEFKIIDQTLMGNLETLLKTADPNHYNRLKEVTINITEPGLTGISFSSLTHQSNLIWQADFDFINF